MPTPICQGTSYPFTELDDLVGSQPKFKPVKCSSCQCGRPKDVRCSDSNVQLYKDDACTDLLAAEKALADQCLANEHKTGSVGSIKVSVPEVVAGSGKCEPSVPIETKEDPSWEREERFCRSRDVGKLACSDKNDVCVPKPSREFLSGVCIYRAGDHNCPAGDYQQRELRFQSFLDDRKCGPCGCGAPTGAMSCTAHLLLYKNATCSMNDTSNVDESVKVPNNLNCPKVMQFASSVPLSMWLDTEVAGLDGASCTPSGGQPTGQVLGGNPITVCCTAP